VPARWRRERACTRILDGIEASRLIKSFEATRTARIIAHSGNPVTGRLDGLPFVAVLQKPATPELVLATVQRAVTA
jgi:CheY-like chemotaxis protein